MSDKSSFRSRLTALLNEHNVDSQTNTPDYLLATFLIKVIDAWELTTDLRDNFLKRNKVH